MTMISAGVGAASGALGIAQGLGLGRRAAERNQLEQQKKLSEQQAKIQNESQMRMWRDTNYEAQVGELKKAGLNPALLYGKGGGGGTTVGAGVGGGQAANVAATQSANTQSTGMGIQGAMMLSQMELMKSQADKAQAEADAIRGYKAEQATADVTLKGVQAESLTQGINNQKAVEALTKVETTLKQIQAYEQQTSQEDRLNYIEYTTNKALEELNLIKNEVYISDQIMDDKIKIVTAEGIGAVLNNALTIAKTKAEYKGIQVNNATIRKLSNDTAQKFIELTLQGEGQKLQAKQIAINELKTVVDANYPSMWEVVGRSMEDFFEGIQNLGGATRKLRKPQMK